VLDDRHDEISDPDALPDVKRLAERLAGRARAPCRGVDAAHERRSRSRSRDCSPRSASSRSRLGGDCPDGAEKIEPDDIVSVGLSLGVFKAAQLLEVDDFGAAFSSFTAVDIETTDRDVTTSEIVEIAAVRVRDGEIVDTFSTLVKPRVPIAPKAIETHGIREADVADRFAVRGHLAEVRGVLRRDVIVAHNGYEFDFRILGRMVRAMGKKFDLCTYDTLPLARDLYPTSRKLVDLARQFSIPPGPITPRARRHAGAREDRPRARRREASSARGKTALVNALDHLGIALALTDERRMCPEARYVPQFHARLLARHATRRVSSRMSESRATT
jgi:hypothetical protein